MRHTKIISRALFWMLPAGLAAGCGSADSSDSHSPVSSGAAVADQSAYGIMHVDGATLSQWGAQRASAPTAYANPAITKYLTAAAAAGIPTSVNLTQYLTYPEASRNQNQCGDCWAWASTGVSEISLGAAGIKDALSVQYINSGYPSTSAPDACEGGTVSAFAQWYSSNAGDLFVPLGNTGAAYADGNLGEVAGTATPFANISTTPNHPFSSITSATVATTGVGQATAITNIKNVLTQNQAVAMAYFLPTDAAWNDFFSFWQNQPESTLWSPDSYSGKAYDSGGGGHEVMIVGYDDTDPSPANHYWIVLNSWGVASNRPNGVFRMSQAVNYDDYVTSSGEQQQMLIFETINITWSTSVALAVSTQPANVTVAAGQPAMFTVGVVGGTPPYSFAWTKNGTPISGASTASYTISAAAATDDGTYQVTITDSASASVTDNPATLTVTGSGGSSSSSSSSGGTGGSGGGSTGGSCAHDICSTGVALDPSCDPCATTICNSDSYCCNTKWNSQCVGEVNSICGQSCN